MNEFLIELQAKLDEVTSKGLINTDIDKIQGQLNKLKVQAEIDPNTISNLVKQLEGVINQKITISNINIDANQAVKNAQQAGQKVGNAVNQGMTQSTSLDSVIDKQVKQLMSEYSIIGEKGSKAFEQIKQAVLNYKKELSTTTASNNDLFDIFSNSANINNVTSALADNMKVADSTKSVYADLLNYIKQINSSSTKIHLPQSIKAEYGDMFTSMRNSLGSAFTTGKGTDFETFVTELNIQLGNTIDMSHGAEYAFEDLVNKVKSARGSSYLSGNDLLGSGLINVSEMESRISSVINNIESEEKRLAQASTASSDMVIQNEEKKQQAIQETAQVQKQLATESLIKSGANVTTFDNTNNAAREAAQYFKELLKDENAVLSVSEKFGKLNGLTSFTVNVKRANGEVESLRYSLENMGTKDDPFYQFKNVRAEINNSGAVKQIQAVENTFAEYTSKLEQFKSTNNNILSGLSSPLSDFENKLVALKHGSVSIDEVKNSFRLLNAEVSKITSNLSGQLSKTDSAIRNIAKGEETISGLRAEFKGLSNSPKEINSELNKLSIGLQNIKKIELEEGRTSNWSAAYKEWENSVNSLTAKLQALKKEQKNIASTQVFKTSDLKQNDIAYMTKVSNTIEKQMVEIQKMSNAKGWKNFDVSGVEQADGLIKKLTLTVTDAEGAIKRFTMQREKLQGNGKAQYGLMQIGDVQVLKTAAQAQEELAQKTDKTNSKLDEQRIKLINKIQFQIETGGYESKVESLISRTRQWTDETGNARINTDALSKALDNLTASSNALANNNTVENQKALIAAEKELDAQIKTVTNSVKSMNANLAKDSTISSLHQRIQEFYDKNGASHRRWGAQLKQMLTETSNGATLTNQKVREIESSFIQVGNAARQAGRLGKSWFQTIREGMSSFSYWTSSTFLVMKAIQEIKKAVTFAKELDSALVNINYTMDVTSSQLENIGNKSIDMAKNLKTSVENVLGAVKLYANAKETADSILEKAQPAIMLSNVTGFSGEESAKYLQTIMNQFDLTQDHLMSISDTIQGVSQSMAHDFSDGIVQINEGISTSGEVARAAGMDLADYASMIGLLVEKTGLAGSQLGNSVKTIITRTTKAGEILGIDEGEISDAEKALRNVGVEVRKTDGEFNAFNDTMRELAKQWDSLSDVEKSNIAFNLAGTRQINVIQTLLRNWSEYEELVNKANNSTGVTFENQEKYASSLEGKMKGLSSTFTSIGDNIFRSDDLSVIVDGLTKIAELFDTITNKTKMLGTIGLGAGLFGIKEFVKNFA